MPTATIKATIASTHPVEKYSGWRLEREALEGIAERLRAGDVPMRFNHDAREPVYADVVDAGVVQLEDGEWALEAELEIDVEALAALETRFAAAGVPGGFSFTATAQQAEPQSGEPAAVTLAADAAAWTDADRAEAAAALDSVIPTRTERLFQYSAVDLATVYLILGSVGLSLLGNAAYDALKLLVSRRSAVGETRIEIHRRTAQGTESRAVITTSDPDVVEQALEALNKEQEAQTLHYDAKEHLWLDF